MPHFKEDGFIGNFVESYDEYYRRTGIQVDTFLISNPIKTKYNSTLTIKEEKRRAKEMDKNTDMTITKLDNEFLKELLYNNEFNKQKKKVMKK